jgi:hypothetical protein
LPSLGSLGPVDRFRALRAVGAREETGTGVRLATRMGIAFLDYDLDGRMDVFSAEGRAEPELNRFDDGRVFAAAPGLWWNSGDGWVRAPASVDARWQTPLTARGVVAADLDGDGDLDVVIAQNRGPAKILRNDQQLNTAWLRIQLVGTRSPRDGTGARVEVFTPSRTQTMLAAPAMGYLSQSESVLTFGLGEDARVRRVRVLWPSGQRQDVVPDRINQRLIITEPSEN